jgi:Ca2+-binding RTX toxin-like protein
MAFVRPVSGHDQIFTVDVDGNGVATDTPTQLTAIAVGDARHPTWSPDSGTIAYSSTQDAFGYPVLYTMSFDGLDQARLGLAQGIPGDMPTFSPSDSRIAYSVPSGAPGAGTLRTTASDGSGTQTTIDSATTTADPDWQATVSSGGGGGGSFAGPPVNTVYPTVSVPFGADPTMPLVGQAVFASTGSWTGAVPMTFTYQWHQCLAADPLNGTCATIPGATSSFFVIPASLYGRRLRVTVTATNSQGAVSQSSIASGIIGEIAPNATATPVLSNDAPKVDDTLTLTAGTWLGTTPLTFTYSWRRCDPFGTLSSCVQIPGATTSAYTVAIADIGVALRVWVTGTNLAGSDVVFTNHTFPVVDKQHFAPSVQTAATLTGVAEVGRTLSATMPSFAGDLPIAAVARWQRCDATGGACVDVKGAKKLTYALSTADLGFRLRFVVRGTNAYGIFDASSSASEPVTAAPPHRKGRTIIGTRRGDYLAGGGFDDVIEGLGGNDTLVGGAGSDRLDGGAGNDVLTGGPGRDTLLGGKGSDTIYAADGERDVIDCGPGNDRAVVDAFDQVKNCEVVETTP